MQSFRTAKEFEIGVIVMNKKEKNILKAFTMVSQIGITILVPDLSQRLDRLVAGWTVPYADMVCDHDHIGNREQLFVMFII